LTNLRRWEVRHPSSGKRARQDRRRFGAIRAIPDHDLLRCLTGQFASALRIEADRLAQRGRARFGPANFVVATTSAQAVICLGLGPRALITYLTQGAIAVVLLQAVNYLQHSGLERTEGARVAPAHSWQSARVLGRFLLLELPHHADHHGHAAEPYHAPVSKRRQPDAAPRAPGDDPRAAYPPSAHVGDLVVPCSAVTGV
jgi:hypothetical protein